jgi:ABC-2 type transport system ATP-binding protein
MNILEVNQLRKKFPGKKILWRSSSSFVAVYGISFTIGEGENVGLLGSNGAGKTTTIQMLLSTLKPTSGEIIYFGKNFLTHRSEILQQVGFASTYGKLPSQLTIEENLDVYGRLYGLTYLQRTERIRKYLQHFDIWHLRNRPTGVLSAGETTRVMLAKAFLAHPRIVLLDEPTAALDPDVAQHVRAFVMEQQREYGVSFLFTSHNMSEVTEVCDRVLVMQRGTIIANNTPYQLAASVSRARVELMVGDGLQRTIAYAKEHQLKYVINGRVIEIEVEETDIAKLLQGLAKVYVHYSEIGIKKPQLEDYFLHIAKQRKGDKQ